MTFEWWIFVIVFILFVSWLALMAIKTNNKIIKEEELYRKFGTSDINTIRRVYGIKDSGTSLDEKEIYSLSLEDLGLE
ncbi:MAG: hypothetical protein IKR04_02800 [Clostridia bacterium]|nr:hypothetical protein [Clostridia bacterium]